MATTKFLDDEDAQLDHDLDFDASPNITNQSTNPFVNSSDGGSLNTATRGSSNAYSYQNTQIGPNTVEITRDDVEHDDLSVDHHNDAATVSSRGDHDDHDEEHKALSEIIDISEYYGVRKVAHSLVLPMMWLVDHRWLRSKSWLQIPLIKYTMYITSMIIGIALSQLIIRGYELKAAHHAEDRVKGESYDLEDVIYFLTAYVLLISILCACFLYLYYQYNSSNYYNYLSFSLYHYHYFVVTCSGIIGYAILYLLIHIQSESYSSSIRDAFTCLSGSAMFAVCFLGAVVFIKQFVFDFNFLYKSFEDEYDTDIEESEYEHETQIYHPLLNDDDSSFYYQRDSENDHNLNASGSGSGNIMETDDDDEDDDDDLLSESDGGDMNDPEIFNKNMDDDQVILNEYKEKGVVWFTISKLTMDIWHIAIGLVMIECVVYLSSGQYVNLLIDWTHDESTETGNIWSTIVFGFGLAFLTSILQIATAVYCKGPLHEYQQQLVRNQEYDYHSVENPSLQRICRCLSTLPHKEDIILFLLNWLNDIGYLWNRITAAAIGWSLLTPNQTNSILWQFITALAGTVLFLAVGFVFADYKRRIQQGIYAEIKEIKHRLRFHDDEDMVDIEADGDLLRRMTTLKQKLAFYDSLHATYDLAFAVAVSYSWESFMVIAFENALGEDAMNRFIAHLCLTVIVGIIFCQFGLELVDLKRERLKEAKLRKTKKMKERAEKLERKQKRDRRKLKNLLLQERNTSRHNTKRLLTSP